MTCTLLPLPTPRLQKCLKPLHNLLLHSTILPSLHRWISDLLANYRPFADVRLDLAGQLCLRRLFLVFDGCL